VVEDREKCKQFSSDSQGKLNMLEMDRKVKNFEETGSLCISVHEGQA
jgi:hypothetical protein